MICEAKNWPPRQHMQHFLAAGLFARVRGGLERARAPPKGIHHNKLCAKNTAFGRDNLSKSASLASVCDEQLRPEKSVCGGERRVFAAAPAKKRSALPSARSPKSSLFRRPQKRRRPENGPLFAGAALAHIRAARHYLHTFASPRH